MQFLIHSADTSGYLFLTHNFSNAIMLLQWRHIQGTAQLTVTRMFVQQLVQNHDEYNCITGRLWLPWQRDSNMVRFSMPWHHHIYKLLPPLPVSELVHTYRHVAWSFWTRVEVLVVFRKQINIVENIAIPLMELVGHDETNIKQHGTIEGGWVSLSMKKQMMSFFTPLRLCENGRNFEGKIFEFSSFNENSWLKLHSCLFLKFQWPVSQRWLRWQAKIHYLKQYLPRGLAAWRH